MTSPASPPPSTTIPPAEVARAAEAAKAAKRLQDAADTLRAQAAAVKDPAERERLFHTAYDNEVEACGQSKKARLMASGWGQGAAAGVGASGALGMALGNLVGVLLGGVVAIPGVLVGAGVGALHGPWYKIPACTFLSFNAIVGGAEQLLGAEFHLYASLNSATTQTASERYSLPSRVAGYIDYVLPGPEPDPVSSAPKSAETPPLPF
ncbi:hypothetical protein N658DRAFT_510857 [Parathielavia hyrcaniae]|uniref:Peptidase S53 activation domain-containing protein n=1 Tax=Parathielavia hyrcaniae TaxID=113614 RepID=A0AAN6SWX2_9PEZI|nr:hypothetical protein N658DRAFT_510857 [Parathielavia hyrcaniae]